MSSLTITRTVGGQTVPFVIDNAPAKLRWRGSLPGASSWDRVAHTLRALQGARASGADAATLLPLALPVRWMVDVGATPNPSLAATERRNRLIQRWLARDALSAWGRILDTIGFAMSPEEWLDLPPARRAEVDAALEVLVSAEDDGTLAAVTNVLALLRPQIVAVMDDAALWFALELVAEPTAAPSSTAPVGAFGPMTDWFARNIIAAEPELIALAARHDLAVLDAAQTLDRLLWIESWGGRMRDTRPASERTRL